MEQLLWYIPIGIGIGTLGTLIGVGGGFILVPLLILTRPDWSAEQITAVSMAIVAGNSISGSAAYLRDRKVDLQAGWRFALWTLPGSVIGVYLTQFVPRQGFDLVFGLFILCMALYLFQRAQKRAKSVIQTDATLESSSVQPGMYRKGQWISLAVGFFSPILGIGGGIIHVPAMIELLKFPVHRATATSSFILAIMATTTVLIHLFRGRYNDPSIWSLILCLLIGVFIGAQLGAALSKRLSGQTVVKVLAAVMLLVGIRIIFGTF